MFPSPCFRLRTWIFLLNFMPSIVLLSPLKSDNTEKRHHSLESRQTNLDFCIADHFTCGDGSCIPSHWECDWYYDCLDETDEHAECQYNGNRTVCNDDKPIADSWICDGFLDCIAGEDEMDFCYNRTSCAGHLCDGQLRCVGEDKLCDGQFDCNDSTDEDSRVCTKECFVCENGSRCIPLDWTCDSLADCADIADESSRLCGPVYERCWEEDFLCKNNFYCIPQSWRCDGENDCGDLSDEFNCERDAYWHESPGWSIWSDWTDCDTDCGQGLRSRNRDCVTNNPLQTCPGEDEEHEDCNETSGCVRWGDWTGWSDCDNDCGLGVRSRSRECITNDPSNTCEGEDVETEDCNETIGCARWSDWTSWTDCDNDCGLGVRRRNRECVTSDPSNTCEGDDEEAEDCNESKRCPGNLGSHCGHRFEDLDEEEKRVVGGKKAVHGDWPWQTQLIWLQGYYKYAACGGTLVHPKIVISAAHCFMQQMADPSKWVVHLGKHDIHQDDLEDFEVERRIMKLEIHPNFNARNMKNDIAILVLDSPVLEDPSKHIRWACLDYGIALEGDECFISGWGVTEMNGKQAIELKEADMPILDRSTCNAADIYGGLVRESMICAGHMEGGTDACQGDSGGPLSCKNPSDGLWYLVGITSWGHGCALPRRPGVFTKVSSFTDWILETVQKYI